MSIWNRLHARLCQVTGKCSHREVIRKDQELRTNLSEHQVDRMIDDSFPASDPPSNY